MTVNIPEMVNQNYYLPRFAPPANVFGTPEENPANACFCNGGHCSPSGLFNISSCQFGSPLVMSWPHFFQADPKLLDDVIGLEPDQEKHQFQLDVLPVSYQTDLCFSL